MNILAICGSIRKESSNYTILSYIKKNVLAKLTWNEFDLKTLPYFDPALQFSHDLPKVVSEFRSLAKQSDYLLISTPEYAHGIPGILKNALEWLVCEETMNKKVAIVIAAPSGGKYVKEYLLETISTMDMKPANDLMLTITNARNSFSTDGNITDSNLQSKIQSFIESLCR